MFAVAEIKGKQYALKEGETVKINKIGKKKGEKTSFSKILLLEEENEVKIGDPYVKGAQIEAEVLGNVKDKKINVYKKKRRKRYERTQGHRQEYTEIKVLKISRNNKMREKKNNE